MRRKCVWLKRSTVALALAAQLGSGAMAQPVLLKVLSGVAVSPESRCTGVTVSFNRPVNLVRAMPAGPAAELVLGIQPLGAEQSPDVELLPESVSATPGNAAGLSGVSYLPESQGPGTLRLSFDHAVQFNISANDPLYISVVVSDSGDCGNAPASDADVGTVQGPGGLVAEGKAALVAKDYARAIALFTKAVEVGNADAKREGQELLGLAHERAGQLPHAKAVYEAYLRLYPSGAGAARVRERLSGVVAAIEAQAKQAFEARKAGGASPVLQASKTDGAPAIMPPALRQSLEPSQPTVKEGWTWERSGSVSAYYYRSDSFSKDADGTTQHDVDQNDAIGAADLRLHGENDAAEIDIVGAAYGDLGFDANNDERSLKASTLYINAASKTNGLEARVGRQSSGDNGIFGRFDGAIASWKMNDTVKLRAVAGSPVYWGNEDKVFADGRYFFGGGVDVALPGDHWSGSLYAIEQNIHTIVDRRAIGSELRYVRDGMNIYGGADFDIYYGEFNNAYLSGSWTINPKLTVSGTADFRRVPFLLTSNALIGQTYDDLPSMVDILGLDDVRQLALDRTATAETAMLNLTYQVMPEWQVALDAMVADYSGTPASGGVDAIPDPGMDYYASIMAYGSNVLQENDAASGGIRVMMSESYNTYIADASYRWNITDALRLNPRFRAGYRTGKKIDYEQIMVMPTLAAQYDLRKNWHLDFESGLRWEDNLTGALKGTDTEFMFSAGLRYEF